ncbi:hypothetical protein SFC65_24720 [Priestia filamentosa]|uniref:hypothetical protein n=1 Tax=Priestia filamentosa TaxID=1402861 RepID=UPI003981A894
MVTVQKLDLKFEMKSMGFSFYAPPILLLLSIVYVMFSSSVDAIHHTASLLEFVICPFSAWWSIYLFLDYYEDMASEVLFSYPLSTFFHGIMRITSLLIFFLMGLLLLLFCITLKHPSISLGDISILYLPQAILYSYVGFTLMILSRNIIFPLLIIAGYLAIKYFTMGGNLFPVYNVMSFAIDMKLSSEFIRLGVQNLAIGIVFAVIGHVILSKRRI